jgi:16S rRNA processing protein RimM
VSRISPADLIPIGRILRPHGLNGLLRIRADAGVDLPFETGGIVYLRVGTKAPECFKVVSIQPQKGMSLLALEGIATLERAETYRSAVILVEKGGLRRDEDEYFWFELIGLEVRLDTGETIGTISRIIPTGAHDIYVAKRGKREIFVPATSEVVKAIDLENGKMIIWPMEGLLDLNEI